MQTSNPVLSRLDETVRQERATGVDPTTRAMTIDDVVVRTVMLLLLTGAAGAFAWTFIRGGGITTLALIGSALAGLVLGLVIAFKAITNPWVIGAYAVLQGILMGVVSRRFEEFYSGIVLQAVVGTFAVFFGMAMLYKFRVLRATPRFRKGVIGALIGVVALSLVNYVVYLISGRQGLEVYSPTGKVNWIPILFSLVCIVVGALTFILDFDAVEQGLRYRMPERYAWYCAFGLLVGLIYLYWQILRLLSYLRR